MAAEIIEDTRQQQHDGDKHILKHRWFAAHGIDVVRRKLDFGDYMAPGSNVSVDTKRDLWELMRNLGAGFRQAEHECARAAAAGCRLVYLVESSARYNDPRELDGIVARPCLKCAARMESRCFPSAPSSGCPDRGARRKPFQGYQMAGRMKLLHERHGAEFEFCEPSDAARIICDRLGVDHG